MTIELSATPPGLTPAEAKLELACALYARGRLGKVAGADLAGVDFFTFQRALGERGIATVTESALEADLAALSSYSPHGCRTR